MRHTSLFFNFLHQAKFRGFSWKIAFVLAVLLAAQPSLVFAHQSPSNCNSNRLNLSIVKDRTEVYRGQTLTYTITASNVNFSNDLACDITNATIDVTLPAADGTPTGQVVTLVTGQSFPAGTTVTQIGSVPYVVNVNSGVTDIVAQASAQGTLHDAPVDHSALIIKTLGTTVVDAPIPPEPPEPEQPQPEPENPTVPSVVRRVVAPRLPNTGMY